VACSSIRQPTDLRAGIPCNTGFATPSTRFFAIRPWSLLRVGSAPPIAVRNDTTTAFNTNVSIAVLANDLDKNGNPASVSGIGGSNVTRPIITRQPNNGVASVEANGTITILYNPGDAFAGSDSLIYQICDVDDNSLCDTALVTIRVLSAPPVATPESINLAFNATITVPILINDADKANRPASLTTVTLPQIVDQPSNGTAIINLNGTLTYTPVFGYAGPDTLLYRICDTFDPTLCDTTFVAFNVGSSAPNATPDALMPLVVPFEPLRTLNPNPQDVPVQSYCWPTTATGRVYRR